jgi:hypothetical protein
MPGKRGEVSGCIVLDEKLPIGTRFWWGGLIHQGVEVANNNIDQPVSVATRPSQLAIFTSALPTATVIHHAGQSSRQWRWPTFVQLWRSRYRFYLQHRDRYPAGFLLAARSLVRTGMACQARRARADFAAGRISGGDLGDALAAYQAVAQL